MELKTCLQFEPEEEPVNEGCKFKPELCLYLPDSDQLIYTEGSFLLSTCHSEPLEFPSNINLIRKIDYKKDSFLFLVLEDNAMAVIDLKTFKVACQFNNDILPSPILQVRQSTSQQSQQQVFLLLENGSLLQIENFVLFTRLTNQLLKERFESGLILKEYTFANNTGIVKDFEVLETGEILTVGADNMISWWTFSTESDTNKEPPTNHPSIINFFFSKPQVEDKPAKTIVKSIQLLKLVRFLNEPDRTIDKIVACKGSLALLEDSTHGRLLLVETELALILKVFKGYRNTSAAFTSDKGAISLWAENRFTLETWSRVLDDSTRSVQQEYPNCTASFDFDGNLFVYSNEMHKLSMYK